MSCFSGASCYNHKGAVEKEKQVYLKRQFYALCYLAVPVILGPGWGGGHSLRFLGFPSWLKNRTVQRTRFMTDQNIAYNTTCVLTTLYQCTGKVYRPQYLFLFLFCDSWILDWLRVDWLKMVLNVRWQFVYLSVYMLMNSYIYRSNGISQRVLQNYGWPWESKRKMCTEGVKVS